MGRIFTEEHKRKLDEANKNLGKRKQHSEKMKGDGNPRYGAKLSDKTKQLIGQANRGNHYSLGHKHTEETKLKMSLNHADFRGDKSPSWKGGRVINPSGYIMVRIGKSYIREHRLVMERYLNRKLYPWEIVHHINGIRDDNRIENLELLPGQGYHNTMIQKIYKENLKLKQRVMELELQLVS